ncbi:MAG: hypothetical protein ISS31_09405 [Kiritimatiellae bacterium]|nr:hypothetical protein [Kiritimatiellia bacterium]
MADEASDYNRRTSQWVIDHVRENDAILTDETPSYCWYLRYHTHARLIRLPQAKPADIVEAIQTVRRNGGHVLATPDVFAKDNGKHHASDPEPEYVTRVRAALRPLFVPVSHNRFGNVWLFRPEQAAQ